MSSNNYRLHSLELLQASSHLILASVQALFFAFFFRGEGSEKEKGPVFCFFFRGEGSEKEKGPVRKGKKPCFLTLPS